MSKRFLFFLSGSALFFAFLLFSYLVNRSHFTQFDFDMTVRLQDHLPRRLDMFFSYFSIIGRFEVMLIALLALFVLMRKWLAGAVAVALFLGFHVIELYGKFFVNHPPPPHFLLRTAYPSNFPQFYVSTDFSYPSGHSGRTLFLATILVAFILASRKCTPATKFVLCGAIGVFVVTMLVSRVYLGEHWASDVIGGGILGVALGLVTG